MTHDTQYSFKPGKAESRLLLWSVPNEVINGFRVDDFEKVIGLSQEKFKSLVNGLRSISSDVVSVDAGNVRALRNALEVVLEELGPDEFQTRTGYDFEDGQLTLKQLDDFLSSIESKGNH